MQVGALPEHLRHGYYTASLLVGMAGFTVVNYRV